MPPQEQTVRLMKEFEEIARDYGATRHLSDSTYKECVRLVLSKFAYLSIFEIREAYRQFAVGEIESKQGQMYHGSFNASNLGAVLAAYAKKRKRVISEYLQLREKTRQEQAEKQKREQAKAKFEKQFPLVIEQAKRELKNWRDVKVFWYAACLKRGYFTIEKQEAYEVFGLAKKIAIGEYKRLKVAEKMKMVTATMMGVTDEISLAKTIARKLVVWTKVLGRELPKVQEETQEQEK